VAKKYQQAMTLDMTQMRHFKYVYQKVGTFVSIDIDLNNTGK
jgi:hypothetical protein